MRRYTIIYSFQGREHKVEYPFMDDEHAKSAGLSMWVTIRHSLISHTSEEPKFVSLSDPDGNKIEVDWT